MTENRFLKLPALGRGVVLGAPVPDDGVQASDLRRTLQHAERLRQRLRLLSRGQERPDAQEKKVGSDTGLRYSMG